MTKFNDSLNDSTRKDDKEFLVRCLKGIEPEFNANAAADYILDGLVGYEATCEPVSIGEIKNILNAFYVYNKASGSRFFDVDGAIGDFEHLFKKKGVAYVD